MRVNEIFYSLQGESSYAGWPCVFIRLTGCNLRCSYCDTQYAYAAGEAMSIGDILSAIRPFACNLVEITGGEPLIQDETPALAASLLDDGNIVLVETNGSIDINRVQPRCIRIVDFKCPSSGEADSNDYSNIDRLQLHDEVKCVIGNRRDYEFARTLLQRVRDNGKGGSTVLFSPVFGKLAPRVLAGWILDDRLPVRFNLPLHKYIWNPEQRGV
ncbi:radical SAM protein [Desulfoferrobacter suflitae]|uniref:radical SAM protein n=1 Tax=Desulfoferrobacter suflitae TaxID=2865782 RepID=UPI0021648046|nr:radical SAM protein [Desulfoferrobacter suflitae]MCK8603393.1 radical SAM protein [Desulfoferrobacter suflitae]